MSCSNNINPWTTSIQPLKLVDWNYYLEALLSVSGRTRNRQVGNPKGSEAQV